MQSLTLSFCQNGCIICYSTNFYLLPIAGTFFEAGNILKLSAEATTFNIQLLLENVIWLPQNYSRKQVDYISRSIYTCNEQICSCYSKKDAKGKSFY